MNSVVSDKAENMVFAFRTEASSAVWRREWEAGTYRGEGVELTQAEPGRTVGTDGVVGLAANTRTLKLKRKLTSLLGPELSRSGFPRWAPSRVA